MLENEVNEMNQLAGRKVKSFERYSLMVMFFHVLFKSKLEQNQT